MDFLLTLHFSILHLIHFMRIKLLHFLMVFLYQLLFHFLWLPFQIQVGFPQLFIKKLVSFQLLLSFLLFPHLYQLNLQFKPPLILLMVQKSQKFDFLKNLPQLNFIQLDSIILHFPSLSHFTLQLYFLLVLVQDLPTHLRFVQHLHFNFILQDFLLLLFQVQLHRFFLLTVFLQPYFKDRYWLPQLLQQFIPVLILSLHFKVILQLQY